MMSYEELIRAIGPGFHPDVRGEDYAVLPAHITPQMVNQVVDYAHSDGSNPYRRAFHVFIEQGWIAWINP